MQIYAINRPGKTEQIDSEMPSAGQRASGAENPKHQAQSAPHHCYVTPHSRLGAFRLGLTRFVLDFGTLCLALILKILSVLGEQRGHCLKTPS